MARSSMGLGAEVEFPRTCLATPILDMAVLEATNSLKYRVVRSGAHLHQGWEIPPLAKHPLVKTTWDQARRAQTKNHLKIEKSPGTPGSLRGPPGASEGRRKGPESPPRASEDPSTPTPPTPRGGGRGGGGGGGVVAAGI